MTKMIKALYRGVAAFNRTTMLVESLTSSKPGCWEAFGTSEHVCDAFGRSAMAIPSERAKENPFPSLNAYKTRSQHRHKSD
jgi:hypothetical protein